MIHTMKIQTFLLTLSLSAATYANDHSSKNSCEKTWNENKNIQINIQKEKVVSCRDVWDDPKKSELLKKMGLDPKNKQWLATGECQQIRSEQKTYTIYKAHYQHDSSDLWVIQDVQGNMFGYFRDMGHYDFATDQHIRNKNANKNGVELKCASVGQSPNLIKNLSVYLQKRVIDMQNFSYDDLSK